MGRSSYGETSFGQDTIFSIYNWQAGIMDRQFFIVCGGVDINK